MGIGPNGPIGFRETGTNKVGMLIPDGAQVLVAPTNQTVSPTTSSVPGVSATILPVDGTAPPIMKTGLAQSTGTATGIFVEAQLPAGPPRRRRHRWPSRTAPFSLRRRPEPSLEPPSVYDSGEQPLRGGNVQIHRSS